MLIQRQKTPAPLALQAPEIPGRTEPALPSGAWGINKAAAQDNFPGKGLKVHIPHWAIMDIGNKVELLLNGNPIAQHVITDATEVDERVTLWIAPRHLLTGNYTLSYRVTRNPVDPPETFTPPVNIYVKLELPGGQDVDPIEGQHSELYMYIDPDIVDGGVDEVVAEHGVEIIIRAEPGKGPKPYPNIAPDDVITLSWGGEFVDSDPVTEEQISDPSNNPILITVEKRIIESVGDTGPEGLAATFMIVDPVGNRSEDWCKETRIEVDTGNTRLEAPVVDQANGNVLDVDALGDDDVLVKIWATGPWKVRPAPTRACGYSTAPPRWANRKRMIWANGVTLSAAWPSSAIASPPWRCMARGPSPRHHAPSPWKTPTGRPLLM